MVGVDNLKWNKIYIFLIFMATIVIATSSVSAASSYNATEFKVSDSHADAFVELGAKNSYVNILPNAKKVPSRFKKHANVTKFQVTKGNKISYRAIVNTNVGMVTNLKNAKVKGATIDFGDKTKVKKGKGWISHTYKKAGWHLIKVNMNATGKGYDFLGRTSNGTGKITNGTKYFLVFVANKPQLVYTKIGPTALSQRDVTAYQKKGQINYLAVTVKNIGPKVTKATKVSIFYQDPKRFGKVDKKLKKFTGTAKLKALKPGKSTNVVVKFTIPKKYANKKIVLKLDSANKNKNQANKARNTYLING